MERETLEKLYAGLIGMDAGMRLGAPVENPFWTYERLQSYYGDIRGYLREQRYYTADDDVNGPLIFVRALADNAMPETLAPETVGETWLNYTRRGMGMFWWGGEDVSTEHRAYMNLRRAVKAPRSGSIEENGKTAAEQIGGQVSVFNTAGAGSYRSLYPEQPVQQPIVGVLSPIVGVIGSLQALETIKLLAGIGDGLAGRLLTIDGRTMRIFTFEI